MVFLYITAIFSGFVLLLTIPFKIKIETYVNLSRGTAIVLLYIFGGLIIKLRIYRKEKVFYYSINGRDGKIFLIKPKIDKRKIKLNLGALRIITINEINISVRYGHTDPIRTAFAVSVIKQILGQIKTLTNVKNYKSLVLTEFNKEDFVLEATIGAYFTVLKIISVIIAILKPQKEKEKVYG